MLLEESENLQGIFLGRPGKLGKTLKGYYQWNCPGVSIVDFKQVNAV